MYIINIDKPVARKNEREKRISHEGNKIGICATVT